ncbi:hypothetical protein OIE71_28340 [Streptomyces sp. NBC_01725]|uniref:hypothetical protein n=1 Tax=Streptomyces sp. NBC_01725 TaxID=2975923 RepID=UPI002E29BAB5|nr:hypothetical protein [Streptomyces sp. NBC_01725]
MNLTNTKRPGTSVLFAAAPALFLGGWLLMRPIDGRSEPGGWWTAAHAVWLAGFVLFAAMSLRFREISGARTTGQRIALTASVGIVLLSALANIVQLTIDLVGGFTSANSAELKDAFAGVKDIPGAEAVVYGIGAQVIFVGLVVFAVLAAVVRRGTPASAALVTAGTVVMAIGMGFGRNHWSVPAGMICLLAGLTLLGRELDGHRGSVARGSRLSLAAGRTRKNHRVRPAAEDNAGAQPS